MSTSITLVVGARPNFMKAVTHFYFTSFQEGLNRG
jgi:hypothetical protein